MICFTVSWCFVTALFGGFWFCYFHEHLAGSDSFSHPGVTFTVGGTVKTSNRSDLTSPCPQAITAVFLTRRSTFTMVTTPWLWQLSGTSSQGRLGVFDFPPLSVVGVAVACPSWPLWGSAGTCSYTLSNTLHRVRGLHVWPSFDHWSAFICKSCSDLGPNWVLQINESYTFSFWTCCPSLHFPCEV